MRRELTESEKAQRAKTWRLVRILRSLNPPKKWYTVEQTENNWKVVAH